jgi:dTDP-4-dehydrorhamnose 3,5-epimerase
MHVIDKTLNVTDGALPGLLVLTPAQYRDARGVFMETYNERVMADLGLPTHWCQDNFSISQRNVVRGLHYQISHPQGKLVRVVYGAVLDVAVDLRRSSPTFGQHAFFELSAENGAMLWIPPGFAHGFLTLTDQAAFAYKVTDYYFAPGERTIFWNDPHIGIPWPIDQASAIVSEKDRAGKSFSAAETFA